MEALKLNINEYKPILTDDSLTIIHKSILSEIEDLSLGDSLLIQRECMNGIKIDVEVEEKGFSDYRVSLLSVYIYDKEMNVLNEYETTLTNMLDNSIQILNQRVYEKENV